MSAFLQASHAPQANRKLRIKLMSIFKPSKERKQSIRKSQLVFSTKRFVVLYLLYMAGMMLLLTDPVSSFIRLDEKFGISVVFICAKILYWTGIPCHSDGIFLRLPNASLAIKFGCNGLEAILILAAGILAFPGAWKRKAVGLLAGAALLQVFNWIRIVLLAISSIYFPSVFDIIHLYIAQGIMIILSLVFFVIYISKAQNPDGV
jgi:exosortase/archaeosortase family protein